MTRKEEKILQDIDKKYKASKNELEKRFEDFNDYEDMYWGYIEQDKNAWKSNIFDPESFEKVERVVSHLFSVTPKGRVLPKDNMEDVEKAPIIDELIRYQWNKPQQNMHSKLQRLGRSSFIFGTAFGLLEWRYEKRKLQVRKGDNYETQDVVIWDDPYFKDLYIYDCFPDPSATNIDDMEYFITNEYTTIEQLKAQNYPKLNMIRYKNIGDLEKSLIEKKSKDDSITDSYRNRVNQILGVDNAVLKERITIRRMFTKSRWYTIAPDFNIVLEDRENPYTHGELPIHLLVDYDYPNQLYGRGEIDVIIKLQKGLNSVLNQRNDNVRLIMSPAVKVKANSRYSHTWKFRPAQKWVMDAMDEVDVFSFPDVTGNTFAQSTNYYKDAMSRALGHNDIMSRMPGKENQTATRDKLAAGEQNARLRQKESNIDAFIVRLMNQWIQLDQQFVTDTRVVRITGVNELEDNGVDMDNKESYLDGKVVKKLQKSNGYSSLVVEPEDLAGSFDFIVESGSMTATDPNDDFQNVMTAMNILTQVEPKLQAEGIKVNYRPIAEKLMTKLGIKNIENILQMQEMMPQSMMRGVEGIPSNPAMANMPLPEDAMAMGEMNQELSDTSMI